MPHRLRRTIELRSCDGNAEGWAAELTELAAYPGAA